jgi:group I intron endonuclease
MRSPDQPAHGVSEHRIPHLVRSAESAAAVSSGRLRGQADHALVEAVLRGGSGAGARRRYLHRGGRHRRHGPRLRTDGATHGRGNGRVDSNDKRLDAPAREPGLKDAGIYKITNSENGAVYVGSAVSVARRWREHRSCLNRGVHGNPKLQRAWLKYGSGAFGIEVLEPVLLLEDLLAREQYWIDVFDAASRTNYNIDKIAGSRLGSKASVETRERLRQAHIGQIRSKESSAKAAESNRGRRRTAEQRARISASRRGKPLSAQHRIAIGIANKGRILSAETRAKLSAAKRGRKPTAEQAKKAADGKRTRLITIDGVTQYLREWLAASPVKRTTVMMRVGKLGWDMKRALTEPVSR